MSDTEKDAKINALGTSFCVKKIKHAISSAIGRFRQR